MEPSAPLPPTSCCFLIRIWRVFKIGAVTLFVLWNLFFLILRNPLDLWWEDRLENWYKRQSWWPKVETPFEKINEATKFYGKFFGVEQGWSMFVPPMARRTPFLAARIEFTDDSSFLLPSENEPPDLNRYFRFGGWRQRKMDDYLCRGDQREKLPGTTAVPYEDLPLYEAYARWCIRRWREQSPGDERTVEHVVLIDRRIPFPEPGTDPHKFDEPETSVIAVFGPDGRFVSKPKD